MNRRLLNLARDSRFALAATMLCGFLAGLLTIGQASLLSKAIDRVFLGKQSLADVSELLRLLLLVVLGRALLAWGSEVSAKTVAIRIKSDLRQRLFTKILALGPGYTRGERTGALVSTAIEGVEALDAWFSQYLPQLGIAALVPVSILLFVFPRDPLSGLILLLTAPLIPLFMFLIGKAAEVLTKRQWDTLSRLGAYFLDSLQGLTTLKELGRSRDQADKIAASSERFRDVTLGVLRVTFLSALVLELVATVSTALVAVEVGLRLLYGHMAFQPALCLLLLAPEFYIPLRMLGLRFHAGMTGVSAARKIFEVLDATEKREGGSEQRVESREQSRESTPLLTTLSSSALSLSALSFTYPGETQPTLSEITLEIHAGEHIALVGTSGVGKSTLASLLLRFIEPDHGQLTVDGRNSQEIPLDVWREWFAWVPQEPYLFNATIAANLRLAKPEATEQELLEALKEAHLDEFIHSLPQGLETVIGEQGARLSAGQSQRLALARAFLKDAPILILDEPTSSLDPMGEALIEAAIRELMRNHTVLTIAHRLNTVIHADRIIVLDGGRIAESGTHQELISRNGLYASMFHPWEVESRTSNAQTGSQSPTFEFRLPVPLVPMGLTFDSETTNPQSTINNQKSKILLPPLSILRRLLDFLRGSWGWVSLSVLLGLLTVGSSVGLMGTSAYLISAAALHPELGTLQVAIIGVRFFGIARGVFRYLERLTSHDVTFRLLAKLRAWFYRTLEPLAPARLMQYRSGDLLGRILSDVESLENFYVRVVSPSLVAILVAAGMTLFLGSYSARLGWVYLAFLILLGLGIPLLAFLLGRLPGAELVARRAELQSRLVDGIQGLPDILAFGQETAYAQNLQTEGKLYGGAQRKLAFVSGVSSALTVFLVNTGILAMLSLSIPLVTAGQVPGVLLAVLVLAAAAGFEAVLPLPLAAQTLSSNLQSTGRLFEIVDTAPEVAERREQRVESREQRVESSEQRVENSGQRIERRGLISTLSLSNLSFTHPSQTTPALQNISFQLAPGRKIAIIGPSGAGKSTLANLLLRFWEVQPGMLFLDGRDVHEFSQEYVRNLFGFISQRAYFFSDTLRQNLLLARPDASQEEIEAAIQGAQLQDFVARLPQGYETKLGERGYRLSGGERQRLAIARALLKDAPIFLLDEPTANLDPLTERRILETLFRLAHSRSLLLITHRLVGLENMDEILVLDQGRIAERGTRAELLACGGLFHRMWNMQQRVFD